MQESLALLATIHIRAGILNSLAFRGVLGARQVHLLGLLRDMKATCTAEHIYIVEHQRASSQDDYPMTYEPSVRTALFTIDVEARRNHRNCRQNPGRSRSELGETVRNNIDREQSLPGSRRML